MKSAHNQYQQCLRCVMDTTDPDIRFDESGYCNHCTEFFEKVEKLKQEKKFGPACLPDVIRKIKASGRSNEKYDVVLGISGGVDSCYTAYLLSQHGIRTLLVHLDNGWNSDFATLNIKNIARALKFDYESFVLDWEQFKDIQLAFLKASVVEAETPTDVAILGALHRVAAKYGVKYIISGGNLATEGILPRLWHYNAKDTVYFSAIVKTFGTKRVHTFPLFDYKAEFYYKFIKGIRILYLLNFVTYNKAEATRILKEKLGWRDYGGKHHESRFTKFIQSYLLPKKFNLDYRKATFSSLICSGLMTREKALEELKEPMFNVAEIERDKEYIAKKLGITIVELNTLIDLPGRYYFEYPNDEKRLNFFYRLYKKYLS
ncbi:MAG TPA: N-acetyl sugar amidotransferase [Flavisolibacter sp.]